MPEIAHVCLENVIAYINLFAALHMPHTDGYWLVPGDDQIDTFCTFSVSIHGFCTFPASPAVHVYVIDTALNVHNAPCM